MFSSIRSYCDLLVSEFGNIPEEKKQLLDKITRYIIACKKENKHVNLVYICTHNSRRSHFGQIWAKVAATYFGINNINTFSGGTEATAFNINAINALKRIGFKIQAITEDKNPKYRIFFGENESPVECFSKIFNDPVNPRENFAAIMTCGEAEENCPFIPGVDLRIATTYEDPKAFDNTPQQDEKYDERSRQIALETLYLFSQVKHEERILSCL